MRRNFFSSEGVGVGVGSGRTGATVGDVCPNALVEIVMKITKTIAHEYEVLRLMVRLRIFKSIRRNRAR